MVDRSSACVRQTATIEISDGTSGRRSDQEVAHPLLRFGSGESGHGRELELGGRRRAFGRSGWPLLLWMMAVAMLGTW